MDGSADMESEIEERLGSFSPPALAYASRNRLISRLQGGDRHRSARSCQLASIPWSVPDCCESKVNSGGDVLKGAAERVFKAKLMGWIRNPYSIARTIDMYKGLVGLYPTDPLLLADFSDIRTGTKPHLAGVCAEFGVTSDQYFQRLEILFLALMTPPGGTKSMLESSVEKIVESQGHMGHVIVATFDDVAGCRVAIPDTGYLQGTEDPNHNMFLFNLNRSAFASFNIVDLSRQTLVKIPSHMREQVSSFNIKFSAQHHHNDMRLLEKFNVLAAYQAHSHIFCADPQVFGNTTIQ